MIKFFLKRLVSFFLALVAASVLIFLLIEILPGDPALSILGLEADPKAVENLRAELGLDRSVQTRYFSWFLGILHGDFGSSWTYGVPAAELILPRLLVTIPLALFAIMISIAIAVPLGLFAAQNHRRSGDVGVMIFGQLGLAIPNFWLGLLLIMFFGLTLKWFPVGGFPGWQDGLGPAIASLTLPAFSLGVVQAAILARIIRAALLEVSRDDFVRTARAKGFSRRRVLVSHVFRNALVPSSTVIGLQFSYLIAGTVIIENVFYLPGLGRLVLQAIANRYLILVENVVMLLVALVIFVNFCVDIANRFIDPRLGEET